MGEVPTYTVDGETHVFMFPDATSITVVHPQLDRQGRLYAEVVAKAGPEAVLNRARIDLLNLQDRERFHNGATSVDGQVNWHARLLFALEHVRTAIATSAVSDKQQQEASRPAIDLASALITFPDMLTLELPERVRYLPWLPERGLAMVYGPRGIGKTQFMLGLATHLATGQSYLGWDIPDPVGVLYIDGEMPLTELRQRAILLAEERPPEVLYFLTSELVYTKLERDLVLTQEAMREAVGTMLDAHPEIRIIILDNISCLFSGISEDSKQDWEPINAWLMRLRHRGLTVVLVHHAGKTGQQRGTSGREDVLDTVIALSWPPQYEPTEGCHFHLHFTKTRSTQGDAVAALDVRLENIEAHGLTWTVTTIESSRKQQIVRLLREGDMSAAEIANELGVSPSYIHRVKREEGL